MKKDDFVVSCGGIRPEPSMPPLVANERFADPTFGGNECIEDAIHLFYQEQTVERFAGVCMAVKEEITKDGHLLFPVDAGQDGEGCQTFDFKTLELDGALVIMAFTTQSEK